VALTYVSVSLLLSLAAALIAADQAFMIDDRIIISSSIHPAHHQLNSKPSQVNSTQVNPYHSSIVFFSLSLMGPWSNAPSPRFPHSPFPGRPGRGTAAALRSRIDNRPRRSLPYYDFPHGTEATPSQLHYTTTTTIITTILQ
jgi:hypothetical protein